MRTNEVKELIKCVTACIQDEPDSTAFRMKRPFHMFQSHGWMFEFGGERAKPYTSGLRLLLEDGDLGKRYSTKSIQKHYQALIGHIYQEHGSDVLPQTVKKEVNAWLKELRERPALVVTYFSVIQGLRIEKPWTIGSLCLEALTQDSYQSLVTRVHDVIDRNTHHSPSEKENFKRNLVDTKLQDFVPLKSNDLALVTVEMSTYDVEYGRDEALSRAQTVIHLLRFLGIGVHGFERHWQIDFHHTALRNRPVTLAFAESGSWNFNYPAPVYPLEMGSVSKESLKLFEPVFARSEDDQTDLDGHIRRAIYWMGKAVHEPAETSQFLNTCIALESLLCHDDRTAISNTVSERLAFLLADKGEERKRIHEQMQAIQRIRGRIAHAGRLNLNREESPYLRLVVHYAYVAIHAVADLAQRHQWGKFEDLRIYLDDRKFAGGQV